MILKIFNNKSRSERFDFDVGFSIKVFNQSKKSKKITDEQMIMTRLSQVI
jgi:hypothetical protein